MGKYGEFANGKPSAYILKREGLKKPGNYQSFILTWIPRKILKEINKHISKTQRKQTKQVTAKRDLSSMSCHISFSERVTGNVDERQAARCHLS